MRYSAIASAVVIAMLAWPALEAKAAPVLDPVCEGYLLNSPHYEMAVQKLDPRGITGAHPMVLKATPVKASQAHLNNLHGMGDRFDFTPIDIKLSNLKTHLQNRSQAAQMFMKRGWIMAFTAKTGAKPNYENATAAHRRLERVLNLALREFHGLAGEQSSESVLAIRGAIIDEIGILLTDLNISHRVVSRVRDRAPSATDLYIEVVDGQGQTTHTYDPNRTFSELAELRQSVADEVVAYVTKPAEAAALAQKSSQAPAVLAKVEITERVNAQLEASRQRVIARLKADLVTVTISAAESGSYLDRLMVKALEKKIADAQKTRITVAKMSDSEGGYYVFKFEDTTTGKAEYRMIDVSRLKAN